MHSVVLMVAMMSLGEVIYFPGRIWHQHAVPTGDTTIIGYSAGARSAVEVAFDPCNLGKVKCVKLISGVYDVKLGVRLVSHGAFRGQSRYDASPLFHVPLATPGLSPCFELYYATNDIITLRHQTLKMASVLRCAGYNVTVCEVPANHYNITNRLGIID